MFPELSQNVNLWSKYIRITLDHVSYRKGNSSWNWLLEGSVGDIKFVMKISCAVDVSIAIIEFRTSFQIYVN